MSTLVDDDNTRRHGISTSLPEIYHKLGRPHRTQSSSVESIRWDRQSGILFVRDYKRPKSDPPGRQQCLQDPVTDVTSSVPIFFPYNQLPWRHCHT